MTDPCHYCGVDLAYGESFAHRRCHDEAWGRYRAGRCVYCNRSYTGTRCFQCNNDARFLGYPGGR